MEQVLQMKRAVRGMNSFYTKGEEIFNGVSHIVGGGLGLLFLVVGMLFSFPSSVGTASVVVFSLSVVLLYTMSALYHMLPDGRAKGVFRIFDHCTIFLLIAGTYTPFCLLGLGGIHGIAVLAAEWGLAAVGIALNAVAMNKKAVKIISMILYVGMGWAIALGFPLLMANISSVCFAFLLAGGVAYTVGIYFYALGKKRKYYHSVWHIFDLFGTVLHALSVLFLLV